MTPVAEVDETLITAGLATARALAESAIPAGDGCTWEAEVVVGIEAERPLLGHGDVGATLYDGCAGIALALAAAASAAEGDEAALLSRAAGGGTRRALAAAPEMLDGGRLGLFDGATGVALGAVAVGRLCDDAAMLRAGSALAGEIAARLEAAPAGAELDLIGGLAGTVLGLLQIGDGAEAPWLRAAAARLAAAAEPQTWGAAWPGAGAGPPLLGLGHGAAGIALALAEAAALDGGAASAAARAVAEGVEYERGWFDPDRVAWPDLRERGGEAADPDGWMAAWCHGAIGIGLSRLRLAQLSDDSVLLAEASAALQAARSLTIGAGTALRDGQGADCSACHGLAGVAELLFVAGAALGVDEHRLAARRVAQLLLEQRDAADGAWPCGLPGAGEVPALMTGSAGIALTLLRVGGAVTVPTPLLPGPAGL